MIRLGLSPEVPRAQASRERPKMLERTIAFLGTQACVMALAWTAWSDEVPDNYLPGTWGIGGAEACGAATTEHITFKPDGTFEATGDG
jgi:hypothetical protein